MPTAEVRDMIPRMQRFFAMQPVNRAYLFGSCSRGEDTPDSDIDIMIDLDKSKPIGLFQYVNMKLDLQDLLHRPIDLVETDELLPFAQESAKRDKMLIYERA
ncbi:MAG: nucleotidyltransferase domain-containing protein [Paludibacteraceae bacterium]|nr:nucleotidyltransferase domain-containing protein [Paludibacteraceae bacterium]